jgi:hypothetical protein
MIVYNVTVKVEHSIDKEWIEWIKGEHAAEVIATGCFDSYGLYKVMVDDERDGNTYSVQYHTTDLNRYMEYIHKFANVMRSKGQEKWGDKFVAFRTILKKI